MNQSMTTSYIHTYMYVPHDIRLAVHLLARQLLCHPAGTPTQRPSARHAIYIHIYQYISIYQYLPPGRRPIQKLVGKDMRALSNDAPIVGLRESTEEYSPDSVMDVLLLREGNAEGEEEWGRVCPQCEGSEVASFKQAFFKISANQKFQRACLAISNPSLRAKLSVSTLVSTFAPFVTNDIVN